MSTNDLFKTTDGFQNFSARIGVSARGDCGTEDNLLSKGHYEFNLVSRNRLQLEAAYRGSWIVGQVIDTFAEDMTRAGIEITTNEDPEKVTELKKQFSRLQIWQSLCDTIKWGRLYGGCLAVLQIKGQKPETPLDIESVGEGDFIGLAVYDRWQLNPVLGEIIQSGPDMGLPGFYDIVLGNNLNDPSQGPDGMKADSPTGQVRVHHTRCVRTIGVKLPFFQAITEMMWGESVLERMWDRLIAFDTATMSCASLINRAQLRTVGIDGLREILGAGGKAQEALIAQFEYMRQIQQNEGITLLDKEDTFASTAYSFAGLSDMMTQFGQQVSGACNPPIPLVRLFGQSPAGMSATGESDIRLYYDGVLAKQEACLRGPLDDILKVMWRSMTGDAAPDDLMFDFTPLWQMDATDKANIAKINTDTVIEAHQEGAIDTATMMKELKQASGDSGLFTHITDEAIEEAENEEPPEPGVELGGQPGDDPAEKVKNATGDSAWKKIKKWLARDADFKEGDHPRAKNGKFGNGGSGVCERGVSNG